MENTHNQCSDETKLNQSNEEEKTDKNTKSDQIKLFIGKKNKERTEKNKLILLKKQQFIEERKKKLAELHKTALNLLKTSSKKKNVQNECTSDLKLPSESSQPEADQPSKETLEIPTNAQKKTIEDLEITNYNDSKNNFNFTEKDEKIHQCLSDVKTVQTTLIEKNALNIDTTTYKDTQLLNQSYKPIMNRIDQEGLQELLINKEMSNKTCRSISTQTEDLSVITCKQNLPKKCDLKQNADINLNRIKTSLIHRATPDYQDDELDNSISNDDNSKIIVNIERSSNNKLTSVSKMGTLSSRMIIEDKTRFSIQTLQQLIQVEELRAKQHHTTLNLTENSLIKRLKLKATMSELQMKDLYKPGHKKYFFAYKQKQRDDIKKLGHILSQVKRLGEVIDLIHKQQMCLLKVHLQYLRAQSSFENVFYKLESLDQIIKEGEYVRKPHNSSLSKQRDNTDLISSIEEEHANQNMYKCIVTPKNNKSPSSIELHSSNIILRRYRGLINQGMTCYLNSLLQILYMTPEFRNVVYQLKFNFNENIDESNSILFQLQKLFLNLQTSSRHSVETTELIRSFGWGSSELGQQRDVEECRRYMFDAFEQEFKNTVYTNIINELYQGKMIEFLKCQECGIEKSKEVTFFEVHLPVRPFGSINACECITEALQRLTESEILYGSNQPFCERCCKMCNAYKYLKFSKLPYILTLHLMRFDYNSEYPTKLNDKIVFPIRFNLNSFVSNHKNGQNKEEPLPKKISESSSTCVDMNYGGTSRSSASTLDETDENNDINGSQTKNRDKYESDMNPKNAPVGPYMYELYAIIIHSGNALGGHYYAYIKDFKTDQWLCFDDQSVSVITMDDIERSYGDSSQNTSGTNAYMLMYRQINLNINKNAMSQKEFPPHLKNVCNSIKRKVKDDKK